MKSLIATIFAILLVAMAVQATPWKRNVFEGPSTIQRCLMECGNCFYDSNELLMSCANDLCIRSEPLGKVLGPLLSKVCPSLVKLFKFAKQ